MSWFSKLFGLTEKIHKSDNDVQEGDYILVSPIKLVTEQDKKDIGEPVISFVKCVINNHTRFNFRGIGSVGQRKSITVTDKKTGEKWYITIDYRTSDMMHCEALNWLTSDEKLYLVRNISHFMSDRCTRLQKIKSQRKQRKTKNERQRLMEIYCD